MEDELKENGREDDNCQVKGNFRKIFGKLEGSLRETRIRTVYCKVSNKNLRDDEKRDVRGGKRRKRKEIMEKEERKKKKMNKKQ
jgi:hypothetical protein